MYLFHKISYAFVGPVMTKFTIALREIGTYKEVLRSQVKNMIWFWSFIICISLGYMFLFAYLVDNGKLFT